MGPAKLIALRKNPCKCTAAEPNTQQAGVIQGSIVSVHRANLSSIGYLLTVQSGYFRWGLIHSQGFCWHGEEECPPLCTFGWVRIWTDLLTGTRTGRRQWSS